MYNNNQQSAVIKKVKNTSQYLMLGLALCMTFISSNHLSAQTTIQENSVQNTEQLRKETKQITKDNQERKVEKKERRVKRRPNNEKRYYREYREKNHRKSPRKRRRLSRRIRKVKKPMTVSEVTQKKTDLLKDSAIVASATAIGAAGIISSFIAADLGYIPWEIYVLIYLPVSLLMPTITLILASTTFSEMHSVDILKSTLAGVTGGFLALLAGGIGAGMFVKEGFFGIKGYDDRRIIYGLMSFVAIGTAISSTIPSFIEMVKLPTGVQDVE